MEAWYEDDPTMQVRVNFPFFLGTGNKNTAVVYFEIEPGDRLGTHTDSAEEILLFLEGTAEVTVGDESGRVSAGVRKRGADGGYPSAPLPLLADGARLTPALPFRRRQRRHL